MFAKKPPPRGGTPKFAKSKPAPTFGGKPRYAEQKPVVTGDDKVRRALVPPSQEAYAPDAREWPSLYAHTRGERSVDEAAREEGLDWGVAQTEYHPRDGTMIVRVLVGCIVEGSGRDKNEALLHVAEGIRARRRGE